MKALRVLTAMALGLLVSALTIFLVVRLRVADPQEPPAAAVNGTILTQSQAAGIATMTARVREHNPAFDNNAGTWVDKEIMYQEAARLGLACSQSDAQQQLQDTYARMVSDGHPEAILIVATDSGDAPDGYYTTSAAMRTPDTASVIQTYLRDPRVIETQREACSIMALARSVNSRSTNGIATIVSAAKTSQPVVAPTATP